MTLKHPITTQKWLKSNMQDVSKRPTEYISNLSEIKIMGNNLCNSNERKRINQHKNELQQKKGVKEKSINKASNAKELREERPLYQVPYLITNVAISP